MSYLKQRSGRTILGCFVLTSVLVAAIPSIDLCISRLFFANGFFTRDAWWLTLSHAAVTWLLLVSVIAVLSVYVFNALSRRTLGGIDGRRVCYLLLVLALGPGLIVNVVLKDNVGRARPRAIMEFGGSKQFTPAFVASRECDTNCSFSSGEAAGAFFSLALASALRRRRATYAAAVGFGAMASLVRVASGAHFFSDTLVSFFVMLVLADVLYYYIVVPRAERADTPVPLPAYP